MRINIVLVFLILSSCISSNKVGEDIAVIGSVYKSIPKFIPAPPIEVISDSVFNKTKNKTRKGIKHNYAINLNYYNGKFGSSISNVFQKKDTPSEKVSLDNALWSLAQQVVREKASNSVIDSTALNEYLNDDVQYLNSSTLNLKDKNQYNVNRLLSFSHVIFNQNNTKAAVVVTNYSDKLDASALVYILEKVNKVWVITHVERQSEIT